MERFAAMSAEERQQFIARMKERGADTSAFESAAPAQSGGRPTSTRAAAAPQAQTIDELFAPLPPIESRGRLWLFVDGQLKPVNVRLGVTDGSFTELLSADLQEGMEIVTGLTGVTSARATPAPGGTANPLMPTRGRGPR